jgi:hypothetical protein
MDNWAFDKLLERVDKRAEQNLSLIRRETFWLLVLGAVLIAAYVIFAFGLIGLGVDFLFNSYRSEEAIRRSFADLVLGIGFYVSGCVFGPVLPSR